MAAMLCTACGQKSTDAVNKTPTNPASSSNTSTTVSADNASDVPATIDTPFLNVDITDVNHYLSDYDRGLYGYITLDYNKVTLTQADAINYPELANTLNKEAAQLDEEKAEELKSMQESYFEYEIDSSNSEDYMKYTNECKTRILRADKTVLTTINTYSGYEGGAHGYYSVHGNAYSVETGKKLSLSDVIVDEEAFKTAVKEKLISEYDESVFLINIDEYLKNDASLSGENELSWSMDYNGITVYFNPYEIASYAEGLLSVRLTYKESANFIDSKYTDTVNDYVSPLSIMGAPKLDVDNDGIEDDVYIVGTLAYDDWEAYEWTIHVGDKSYQIDGYGYYNDSYIVKRGDKFFAYVFNTVENDYRILKIIDLASGNEVKDENNQNNYGLYVNDYNYDSGNNWKKINAFTNPDSVILESRLDVLGTYSGIKEYAVGSDGRLVTSDEFFTINRMGYMISATKDIPCKLVDKDGNVINEKATLPKDITVRIIRTDGKKIVDLQEGGYTIAENDYGNDYPYFFTEDPIDLNKGTFYRIQLDDNDDYIGTINNESTMDIFKGMMFAG